MNPAGAQTDIAPPGQLRSIVAAQATSDLDVMAAALTAGVDTAAVAVERMMRLSPTIDVWRCVVWSVSHDAVYLIASSDRLVWRLGGFSSPDPYSLSDSLPLATSRSELRQRARLWARLLDPNGAVRLIWQDDDELGLEGQERVLRHWRLSKPETWPQDTLLRRETDLRVRLTVLSWSDRSYHQSWSAIAYSFVFSHDGKLLSWARRTGPRLVGDRQP